MSSSIRPYHIALHISIVESSLAPVYYADVQKCCNIPFAVYLSTNCFRFVLMMMTMITITKIVMIVTVIIYIIIIVVVIVVIIIIIKITSVVVVIIMFGIIVVVVVVVVMTVVFVAIGIVLVIIIAVVIPLTYYTDVQKYCMTRMIKMMIRIIIISVNVSSFIVVAVAAGPVVFVSMVV